MTDPLPAVPPDPVLELYLRDVDRTLLRRNLSLSHQERLSQLQELARFAAGVRRVELREDGPRVSTPFGLPRLPAPAVRRSRARS